MTPTAYATVHGADATFTAPDGHTEKVIATPTEDIRASIVRRAATEAQREGSSLLLVTSGDRGDHQLLVHADGQISSVPAQPATPADGGRLRRDPETHVTEPTPAAEDSPPQVYESPEEHKSREQEGTAEVLAGDPPRRESFIAPSIRRDREAIEKGWRGTLARVGITVPPSRAQVAREGWIALVSQHWAGCRPVAVANGKGGVGKTITTAMLAAVFGRHGGGNVLAWDNNDTRGTLGWRTEQGLYDTTIRDLLPAADELLAVTAGVSDISRFVHHQAADRYDVLRSNPELLAADQRMTPAEFDLLLQVASRYYRMLIWDSGNDESADRWLRMVDSATQLVIPTLVSPESAESAALLLDALRERDERSKALADNAVVIVTQSEPARRDELQTIIDGFTARVREVAVVPFDPALKSGALRFDALRSRTRDAWLQAAAFTAQGL